MRVAGAGHSFSGGVATEGTLISLDLLARVLDADAATGLVRVEAGIRLHQLSQELHARGLAMPNLGDIDAQSLAGALSTGTHGTGTRFPNLAGQVESVELILADGSERIVRDGDLLRAARVSLGALGVIAAVTIRCVPAFKLRIVDRPEPLDAVLGSLQERADAHDHFEFWTFPHADAALMRTLDETDATAARPSRAARLHERRADGQPRLPRRERGRAALPEPDPAPESLRVVGRLPARARRLVLRGSSPRSGSCASRRWSTRSRASTRWRPCCAAKAALERHPVSFPIELRFSAADDALLSPAHERESTFVAVHVFRSMAYEAAFRDVEAALGELGGRPHWGKRSFLSAAELAPRYPRWDAFQAFRARARPRGPVRQRVGPQRAGIARMKSFNVFGDVSFESDAKDPEGYKAAMNRFGPTLGGTRIGCSVYEIPPGQSLCPYHWETEEEWLLVHLRRAHAPPSRRRGRAQTGRRRRVRGQRRPARTRRPTTARDRCG